MLLLHNSKELYAVRNSLSPYLHSFLVQQFSLLEDEDPQMDVYGNPEFLCTTGTIGLIYSLDELEGLEILDEVILSEDIRFFTCLAGSLPLDVILISNDTYERGDWHE